MLPQRAPNAEYSCTIQDTLFDLIGSVLAETYNVEIFLYVSFRKSIAAGSAYIVENLSSNGLT